MIMASSTTQRQWQSGLDGISNLQLAESSIPSPSADEVLIKISYVSLNYKDGETVEGLFKHHKSVSTPMPLIPCSDAAGTIVSLGKDVHGWKEGDRVLTTSYPNYLSGQVTAKELSTGIGASTHGVLCQYKTFPAYGIVQTPDYLSDEEACTMQIAGVTAWMAINGMRPMGQPGGKGERILLQGTGGVSIMGLLIAKASCAEGTPMVPYQLWLVNHSF